MRRDSSLDDTQKHENHQKNANWLSILIFWYTIPIFREGKKRDLEEYDLTKPLDEHKSELLGEKIATLWTEEVQRSKEKNQEPNLTRVLYKCFKKDLIVLGSALCIMELVIRLFQPLFLGLLLRYFEPLETNSTTLHPPMYMDRVFSFFTRDQQSPVQIGEAYLFAFGIFFCSVVNIMVMHPAIMGICHLGMKMRIACCSLIYRKTLRLSLDSLAGSTAGNVVNLMSNDVNRFDMALIFLHYLWIGPVQMLVSLYFMYREMGKAAIVGSIAIFVFIPLQAWFGNRTSVFRLRTAMSTDQRVKQMNAVIQGMQVIKMYAWEYAFSELIHKLRRDEIMVLKYNSYIRGMIMSFIMFTTRLAVFLTVVAYVTDGKHITAEKVFVISSYYQIMRQTMTLFFPQGIALLAEANVTVSRVKQFLLTPECNVGDPTPLNPKYHGDRHEIVRTSSTSSLSIWGGHISIQTVSAKFANEICLREVSLEVERGHLTAIIGPVGSGKTSLLNLVLGEIEPIIGKLEVTGVISYACQEPWLFAGSVRQNILFGRKFERQRYQAVVRACALARDFKLLPYGDMTIVGERGASLSGGQRARINLARAVYKRADIYLLDDPLSAVDTHVGKHLFDQCVCGFLADKVVILVTHQLQYLSQVSQVVLMHEGTIAAKGSYHSLQVSGLHFSEFLKEQLPVDIEDELSDDDKKLGNILRQLSRVSALNLSTIDLERVDAPKKEVGEMRTYGSVECYIYKEYFKAGGNCCVITTMISLFFLAQFFASASDYFMSQWVKVEEIQFEDPQDLEGNLPFWGYLNRNYSIVVYSIIIIGLTIIALTRSFVFFTVCMRASINLHDRMFDSVIRGSMKFFNTNTSGRILNRFSKDLGAVDELLPTAMIDCTQIMLNLLGAVIVVAAVNPYLIIPTVFMCAAFYFFRQYYLHTSRSVKRLEGICRSPVFGHLNATLQGLSTIRSNGAEVTLTREFDQYQDVHSSAFFMFIATSRAFGLWLDFICTSYIGLVSFFFIIYGHENGSNVGLAITQAISLSGMFQWGLKQSAELENQMTSVERVLEYTNVEHEPDLQSDPEKKPPPEWPPVGRIQFKNLIMRYKPEDPPVLKSLNLDIQPKEKIGIVGRTGAGKSSMIAALFRLSPFEGQIIIDEVDTTVIGLHDLRKKISIIPQEPVLFSGDLRYNMDPFNQYDDQMIISALIDVEIKVALSHGIGCLKYPVSEGGANISVGERQMVCLARAILRNNVVLVLDEATANVDAQTDKFIQTTIRKKFEHCTVLTIAHRLHTVMDSDRVLVMDAGIAVEFDHPHILLENPNGIFTQMVEKTGQGMSDNLKKIARNNYELKQKLDDPQSGRNPE